MAEKYTNIRLVLDKIMRHPLLQDVSLETLVDYAVDFMRIVGVPDMFEEKTVVLDVEKYRAALPCDYYQIIQIRKVGEDDKTFRYSNDSFHKSKTDRDACNLTYKIQGNIIYTSMEEGQIEVSYEAIPVDETGYPKIPDNSSFTRALSAYVKKECFTILFDMGKVSPAAFQQAQQDYAWAVGDCQTEFNRLTIDKAESFYNSWKNLIMDSNAHDTGFRNIGNK